MHSEYAVEPAAMGADWQTFRYLFEKFGFDKGRVISRLPKAWEKRVISSAKEAGVPDVKMKSIIERLRGSKRIRVVELDRQYDPAIDWPDNARSEHAKRPFHAMIGCQKDATCAQAITPDECDDDNALLVAPTSKNIPRTPDEIASAVFLLALASKEIDLIDPYFDLRPVNGDYTGPLAALLGRLAATGCEPKTIRIHYRTHDKRPPDNLVARDAPGQTQGFLPAGYVLKLYEWQEIAGGEDFHDRFVLTECGGLTVGAGLSAAAPGETATISLLDYGNAQQLRARFADGATIYNKVGATVQIESGGIAKLI